MHLCLLVQVVDPAQYKTLSCFYHSVQGLLCLNDFVYLQLTPAILGCSGYCCRWISDHLVRGPTCFDFHIPAQHCEGTTLHLLLLRKVSDLPQEWTSSKLGCLLFFFLFWSFERPKCFCLWPHWACSSSPSWRGCPELVREKVSRVVFTGPNVVSMGGLCIYICVHW